MRRCLRSRSCAGSCGPPAITRSASSSPYRGNGTSCNRTTIGRSHATGGAAEGLAGCSKETVFQQGSRSEWNPSFVIDRHALGCHPQRPIWPLWHETAALARGVWYATWPTHPHTAARRAAATRALGSRRPSRPRRQRALRGKAAEHAGPRHPTCARRTVCEREGCGRVHVEPFHPAV